MHSTTYIKTLNMMQTLTFSATTFEKGGNCIWTYCICHHHFYNQNFITNPTVRVPTVHKLFLHVSDKDASQQINPNGGKTLQQAQLSNQ
jgi:hypothetical protein